MSDPRETEDLDAGPEEGENDDLGEPVLDRPKTPAEINGWDEHGWL